MSWLTLPIGLMGALALVCGSMPVAAQVSAERDAPAADNAAEDNAAEDNAAEDNAAENTIAPETVVEGSVPANEANPSPRDEEARALFEAAEAAHRGGHYEDALERFQSSYELSGRAELLFNIGATSERLRLDARALDAYQRYLDAMPDAENRGEVEARMRILQGALAGGDSASDPEAVHGPSRGPRVMTWVLSAASVAFAGLATASWFVAEGKYNSLLDDCTMRGGCPDEEVAGSSVKTFDRLTNASIVLSATSAVAAIVSFFVEGRGDATSESPVSVGVGPQGASITGRF